MSPGSSPASRAGRPSGRNGKQLLISIPCLVLLLEFPLATQAASGGPDPHALYLSAGAFDPLEGAGPASHFSARAGYPAGAKGGYVVQFDEPIDGSMRSELEALGVTLGGSLPVQALEAVMSEEQSVRVAALPGVRWVGPYQPSWKVSPALFDQVAAEVASSSSSRRIQLRVSLFADAGEEGLAQLRGLGARLGRREQARSCSTTARVFTWVSIPSPMTHSRVGSIPRSTGSTTRAVFR